MSDSLFRPEVLEALKCDAAGVIQIRQPMSYAVLAYCMLGVFGLIVIFCAFAELSSKATVVGTLMPKGGVVPITTPQVGTISKYLVDEGQSVEEGQPLVEIRSTRQTSLGEVSALAEQTYKTRKTSLASERIALKRSLYTRLDALDRQIETIELEKREAESELVTVQKRIALSNADLERHEKLAAAGYITQAQMQQKQQEALDLTLRAKTTQRSVLALYRDALQANSERVAIQNQVNSLLEQLERSEAALQEEMVQNNAKRALTILSPEHAVVGAVNLPLGQAVQPGQAILSLIPQKINTPYLEAHLFAPSKNVGFVTVGQDVSLHYAAFPYQKFGSGKGRVLTVSRHAIAPHDLPAHLKIAASNEPVYRIVVSVDRDEVEAYGKAYKLTAGMEVEADIRRDKRHVWEWLLEPIFSIKNRS